MKKIIFAFATVVAFSAYSYCQSADPSVVATAGGHYQDADMQVSWTLGETIIATISDGSTTLTQGFHQESYEIIGLKEVVANDDYIVKLFPNPTDNLINCEVANIEPIKSLTFRIMDAKGNLINAKEFKDLDKKEFFTQFNLAESAPGEYFIQILNNEYNKSFKIIKK